MDSKPVFVDETLLFRTNKEWSLSVHGHITMRTAQDAASSCGPKVSCTLATVLPQLQVGPLVGTERLGDLCGIKELEM